MKPQHGFSIFRATLVAAILTSPAALAADPARPTLREAYKDHFLIGTAGDVPGGFSSQELKLIKDNFSAFTPENYMKPAAIHPAEDIYSFARPDALVKWCLENDIKVHGHTLAWHAQTGNWFFQGGDKAVIAKRLQDHIKTVVTHYKGKVYSWDVINEAINDGGGGGGGGENLRNSQWFQALGPEFFNIAFNAAHEADPQTLLYYNDYNIEAGAKHQASLVLLKRLKDQGVPVHGVGIQGHWSTRGTPFDAIDTAITNYAALGLKVSITELDITIDGQTGGQLGGRGGRGGAPADQTPTGGLVTTLQNSVLDLSDELRARIASTAGDLNASISAASGAEREELMAEAEAKLASLLTSQQAAKWQNARLKAMARSAFAPVAFSDAQLDLADVVAADSAQKLAAAKDKGAVLSAKAAYWSKALDLLSDTQLSQLMASTFPASGGRGGMAMGARRGGAAVPAPQAVSAIDSILASLPELTADQKAKLNAANDELNAKIRDWQTASQRVLVLLQPQYSAGQVSYDHEIKELTAEQFKQNSIREDLVVEAEIKMIAALAPEQAKKWLSARLSNQASTAFSPIGGLKVDALVDDAAAKLAAAKDKAAVASAKTEFWKKSIALLSDVQTVQLFGSKAVNLNIPNPNAGIASAEALQRQAQTYTRLFQIFDKHKDVIDRVTFWGLNDIRSWRPGQAALLFDVNNNTKPAYDAIIDVVFKKTAN